MNDIHRCTCENYNDNNGNPAGGYVAGRGLSITWQDGPLGQGETRIDPNGAFVETVISAAKQRLEYYQSSKFKCIENEMAIIKLKEALLWLNDRTRERIMRNVEGTHKT